MIEELFQPFSKKTGCKIFKQDAHQLKTDCEVIKPRQLAEPAHCGFTKGAVRLTKLNFLISWQLLEARRTKPILGPQRNRLEVQWVENSVQSHRIALNKWTEAFIYRRAQPHYKRTHIFYINQSIVRFLNS